MLSGFVLPVSTLNQTQEDQCVSIHSSSSNKHATKKLSIEME